MNNEIEKDWADIIRRETVSDILEGKKNEIFVPYDGKSMSLKVDYRWSHHRTYILDKLIDNSKHNLSEFAINFINSINELITKDEFVAIQVLRSFLLQCARKRNNSSYLEVYSFSKLAINNLIKHIVEIDEFKVNIPPSYPGEYNKMVNSMLLYQKEISTNMKLN